MTIIELDTLITRMLQKYPVSTLRIALDLVTAGIKNGQCTGDDVTSPVDQPNIIGCVFHHIMPRLGFKQSATRVRPRRHSRHGSKVNVWVLSERYRAEAFARRVTKAILPEILKQDSPQMQLGI